MVITHRYRPSDACLSFSSLKDNVCPFGELVLKAERPKYIGSMPTVYGTPNI